MKALRYAASAGVVLLLPLTILVAYTSNHKDYLKDPAVLIVVAVLLITGIIAGFWRRQSHDQ